MCRATQPLPPLQLNPRKRRLSEPQIKAPPHNSSVSKKRPSSSRQTVKMRDAENDLRPRHTPLGSKLKPLASGVQIPRKLFSMVRKIFEEHDADGDGFISEREFIRAVSRADEAQGEREAERISERYFDKGMGATVGGLAAVNRARGPKSQTQHASAMFHAGLQRGSQISLVDFVALYFPHLPRTAVVRAVNKYTKKPPPSAPPKKTLNATQKNEIVDMFTGLDSDSDGLVRVKSLERKVCSLGISQNDLNDWMMELPPQLHRAKGNLLEGASLSRMRSKLNLQDMEKLLAPTLLLSPRNMSYGDLKNQLEFNADVALDVLYGT